MKKNIETKLVDKSVKETKVTEINHSFDEIVIKVADPKRETIIKDNKGNTKTFKNVESISIKKQKESIKQDNSKLKNDIKEAVRDKTKTDTKKESISDMSNLKWIFISLAVIAVCVIVFKIS